MGSHKFNIYPKLHCKNVVSRMNFDKMVLLACRVLELKAEKIVYK